MRFDRKFYLIAPTLVLVFIVAGVLYTATRLRQIVAASDNWQRRSDYVTQIEHGQRHITNEKAVQLVRLSLEAEHVRSSAIIATNQLLLILGAMTFLCCGVLLWAIKGVPRTLPLRGPVLFRISPGSSES
ncbi:MAG TPA: hypothetical protein VJW73_17425 [Gemmatimonadaceae bacterium]|nr:hypothetical protein [Gemmatimonadaceae bacterium]